MGAENLVQELLHTNAGCKFPCWWGITPGVTTVEQAMHWIASFSWYVIYSSALYNIDQKRGGSIDFKPEHGVIRVIQVSQNGNPTDDAPLFLPLSRLLADYGQPDQVYLRGWPYNDDHIPAFFVLVIYSQKGIIASYSGEALIAPQRQLQICFKKVGLDLIFWDPDTEENKDFVAEEISHQNNRAAALDFRPIEEDTDLNPETFYRMMLGPNACFLTPIQPWDNQERQTAP